MTLGQLLHGELSRRDPEARPWDWLAPCQQKRHERAACAVAAAVEPGMETLRAELAQALADVAKWRSAAVEAGKRSAGVREELADHRALLSEVLDDLKPPANAPEGILAWDVTVHVTAEQFAAWMDLGGVPAL